MKAGDEMNCNVRWSAAQLSEGLDIMIIQRRLIRRKMLIVFFDSDGAVME